MKQVHFASLMDLFYLKNSELEPQYQKYQGRVVLRGDIVKYDSGPYAVFTEQGSSASQMTAAQVMHIICIVGKQIEDYWNVDGENELSDAWTGFTRFVLLN